MSDIVKDIEAVALFACRNDGCAEGCSYPAKMLAEHPDGGPICVECWDEESSEEDPLWCDLPPFSPFAPFTSRIKELEGEVEKAEMTLELLRKMRHGAARARDAALAENERLREALEKISSRPMQVMRGEKYEIREAMEAMQAIAAAALKGVTHDA